MEAMSGNDTSATLIAEGDDKKGALTNSSAPLPAGGAAHFSLPNTSINNNTMDLSSDIGSSVARSDSSAAGGDLSTNREGLVKSLTRETDRRRASHILFATVTAGNTHDDQVVNNTIKLSNVHTDRS
mmetsp:Transcript_16651/g.36072  ORF Transcript_16651/g.36072 Transcript_16651/m.36072 type:complete len:127 (+) Transcript_16651:374-754(+)